MIDNQLRLYTFLNEAEIVKEEPTELNIIQLEEITIGDVELKTEAFEYSWGQEWETPVSCSRPETSDETHFETESSVESTFVCSQERSRNMESSKQLRNGVESIESIYGMPGPSGVKIDFDSLLTDAEEVQVKIAINKRSERGFLCNNDDITACALRILQRRKWGQRVHVSELPNTWATAFRERHPDLNMEPQEKVERSCDFCGVTTEDLRNMRLHMKLHSEKYLAKPAQRMNRSYTRSDLGEALTVLHEDTVDIKEVSNRYNIPVLVLRRHMRRLKKQAMEVPAIFKCSYCDKIYNRDATRRQHEIYVHLTPAGEFPCDECGKVFPSKVRLRSHYKGTHFVGIFKCFDCGEEFKQNKDLERHKKVHRPSIACDICGKLFQVGSHYYHHLRSHNTTETIVCPYEGCFKEYREQISMDYHITNAHGPNLNIKCPKCIATFPNEKKLKRHDERSHAEARFFCMVAGCAYKNTRKEYLKLHLGNHKDIDVKYRDELIASLKTLKVVRRYANNL